SLYAGLQAIAFLAALLALGRLLGLDRFLLLCLAFILLRAYEPLASDMRLGNVGALQLLALTGLLALAWHLSSGARARGQALLGAVFLTGLGMLALAKLNLALALLLMALSFVVSRDLRAVVVPAVVGIAASTALALVPCAYFGARGVWLDWYAYTF